MRRRCASTISGLSGRTADEYDHHVGVADVRGVVPDGHADAERLEPRR